MQKSGRALCVALLATTASLLCSAPVLARPLAMVSPGQSGDTIFREVMPQQRDDDDAAEVPAHLRRQVVDYRTGEAPGTIIIDTPNTYLYYVLGNGKAVRYGIGVGRDGFTWSGTRSIDRKTEWPDWIPPAEMVARQPYLPRFMAGGPGNPLGARAMYLGGTLYRIHGTNQPTSIGQRVSSGCIRMVNADVIDLFNRVNLGTKVVVLPDNPHRRAPAAVASAPEPVQAAPVAQIESEPQRPQFATPFFFPPPPFFASSATRIY